ncbi:hypothetical protein pEaSNUABM49_00208 [Erwinia phage pEa_SNUABM_49]|nr:hypothetical protein pEaSNUABM49_00208 [Erwinia phage pEa_SNUABM_49]
MIKYLGNDNKVPNNYVYTSHTGSEYIFLEGLWYNCKNMTIIDPSKNYKMNKAAAQQISEQNISSTLKIGQKYIVNESEYVYVGRNKVTKNDSLLHESINNNIISLMEADNASEFSNFVRGDTTNVEIPNKFRLDGDYYYIKSKNAWWKDKLIDDTQFNKELNRDAIKEIQKYNAQDEYPVNSTFDWKGQTMTWTGSNWVYPDGKIAGHKFTSKVDDYIDENPDIIKPTDSSGSSNPEPTDNAGGQPPTNPAAGSSAPDGYVYTSNKGKSYVKRGGKWYDTSTKKPINSSAVPSLERAAANKIAQHDASSPVKIGQEFKAKSGKTYRYVGGNRFMSDDGKLLPDSTARQVLANLNNNANNGQGSSSSQGQPPASNSGGQPPVPPSNPPSSGSGAGNTGGNPPRGGGNDPLQSLADEIKSSPDAPRIVVLLSRGDALSLLAADILLSGQKKEAAQILNSLNN